MRKKILSVFLASAMVISMTACGSTAETAAVTTEASAVEGTTVEVPEEATEEVEAPEEATEEVEASGEPTEKVEVSEEVAEESIWVPSKETTYNSDGTIDSWCEYEYDSNGNMEKETSYNSDGTILDWSEWEYIEISFKTQ